MDHVAILSPASGALENILAGRKTVESRWYARRVAPWNRVNAGDTVYFKNAGQPVTAKALVASVRQLDHPSAAEVREVAETLGGSPGLCLQMTAQHIVSWAAERPYVILLFLKDAQPVVPFAVAKDGFGSAAAWMCVGDIRRAKKTPLPR